MESRLPFVLNIRIRKLAASYETRSPNTEIRNKSELPKIEILKLRAEATVLNIRILDFVFVSDFEFRICLLNEARSYSPQRRN